MTVAELVEHRRFRITEKPAPDPRPGEVQARIKAVGICGSDLHYFSEGGIGDTPAVYPMVLGHEPIGEISKIGAGVTGLQRGDTAALEAALYCYHCEFCRTGHHNVCENMKFMSSATEPGFFRTYVNLPAHNLLPLPRELDIATGTLFEPLTVVLHSMKFVHLSLGETAAVFGAGPIGLLTIAVLKTAGASRVWCIEPLASRREMATLMGADAVIDPGSVDPAKQVLGETGKRGVDVAVDCASKGDSVNQAMDVTRNAGRVVITGIPSEAQVKLNFHVMRRKELAFYTVRRTNHETAAALEMMRQQPKRFAPMVTHSRPIEGIQGAFELLERYEDGVGKVVLTF